jgi:APA family basic amino acid/polyamine antiporter
MKSESKTAVKKELGFWMTTALVVGNMVGSGVFLLPASLAIYGGISIFGWIFTTIGAILLAFVFSQLSRMVPGTGGPYIYTRRGFGDFAGFIVAWGYWISIQAGNAAIAVAMVGYLTVFWPIISNNPLLAALIALSGIWLLTLVNIRGVRSAGYMQLLTTVIKLLPLVAIAIFGFLYFDGGNFRPFNVSGQSNFSAITATAALTLWAFCGLESATVPAENVKDPERTIPRATILGTLISSSVYIFGTIAVMGIIKPLALAKSTAPFSDAANLIWGSWTGYAVAIGAAVSCFGALNGWILLQGQIPLAAAKDNLFPKIFRRLSKRGTPASGLIISSTFITLLIFMNYTRTLVELFTFIILLAVLTALLPYIFSTMAELMILIKDHRQFRRRTIIRSSIISVLAFLYSLWAIAGSGRDTVYWGFILVLAGLPVYVWINWRTSLPLSKEESMSQVEG